MYWPYHKLFYQTSDWLYSKRWLTFPSTFHIVKCLYYCIILFLPILLLQFQPKSFKKTKTAFYFSVPFIDSLTQWWVSGWVREWVSGEWMNKWTNQLKIIIGVTREPLEEVWQFWLLLLLWWNFLGPGHPPPGEKCPVENGPEVINLVSSPECTAGLSVTLKSSMLWVYPISVK